MMRLKTAVCLVTAVLVASPPLSACGDKFLVPNRGTRLQRAPLERHAAILVYSRTPGGLSRSLADADVTRALQKVGYKPTAVTTPAEFARALTGGGWEVVLVNGADAAAARAELSGTTPPAILPIFENPSRDEFSAAKLAYAVVIKAPVKHQTLLDAVDRAIELRADAMRKAARRNG